MAVYYYRVPREFGGVVLIGAASAIVLSWQTLAVRLARRKMGIPAFVAYTDDQLFNGFQRAHQNTYDLKRKRFATNKI
jgi:hypothetical protein